MFREYEKTFRLDTPGKRSLDASQVKQLLSGKLWIEEKLDGANTGIIRHKRGFNLQKRSALVGQSEHPQFQFMHSWANSVAYERIMSIPLGYTVYGEWLRCLHTIHYTCLPDWFVVFDVWDGHHYLGREAKESFCRDHGFALVPLLDQGYFTKTELENKLPLESAFGPVAEGLVVKKYHKDPRNFMKAKIIHPQFYKLMDEKHWSSLPVRYNTVAPSSNGKTPDFGSGD